MSFEAIPGIIMSDRDTGEAHMPATPPRTAARRALAIEIGVRFVRGRGAKVGSRVWAWYIDNEHCGTAATMDLALVDSLSAAVATGKTTEERCRRAAAEDIN